MSCDHAGVFKLTRDLVGLDYTGTQTHLADSRGNPDLHATTRSMITVSWELSCFYDRREPKWQLLGATATYWETGVSTCGANAARWSDGLHLLLLHALFLFANFCEAPLQVITTLQGLLKLSLHVVYLKNKPNVLLMKPIPARKQTYSLQRIKSHTSSAVSFSRWTILFSQ